jgi:hypothetical protein
MRFLKQNHGLTVLAQCVISRNYWSIRRSDLPDMLRATECLRADRLGLRPKKSSPITGLNRPWRFHEVEAPSFQDSRHMKVVRLSALRTGYLTAVRGHSAAGRIMSMTPSGIEPATLRLVAQCNNNCVTSCPGSTTDSGCTLLVISGGHTILTASSGFVFVAEAVVSNVCTEFLKVLRSGTVVFPC